jgi:DNA-binding CsgD family transcriptional regulator
MRAPTPPARDDCDRRITVLVAGGSASSRGAVVSVLDREDGFTVVHAPHSADLGRMVGEHRPQVAVVIGDTDPLPAVRALTAGGPPPRVLVLSPLQPRPRTAGGPAVARPGAPAGATAGPGTPELPGDAGVPALAVDLADMTTLVPAVRLLRSGYQVCSARTAPDEPPCGVPRGPHAWERFGRLTGREIEVVHLMLRGWSNAEIAEALTLSGATVKSHVRSLMSKLQLRSRIDVITTAYTTGFVRPR